MLALAKYSPRCQFRRCKYNVQGQCGLNVKSSSNVIQKKCLASDNWFIVGSFVLDHIFGKTTANDIDLVAPEGEMPAKLSDDALNSPLRIEMVWFKPEERSAFECYNISLPRITAQGMVGSEVAEGIKTEPIISVLPRRKKLDILSICIAVKAMVKYDMKLDERTLRVWTRSIESPPNLKKAHAFMLWTLPIESVDWDYVRAKHLMNRTSMAYRDSTDSQRNQYLDKLRQVLANMPLSEDIAYKYLMKWLDAVIRSDNEKREEIEKVVHEQGFKLRKR